ncbi:class I SAM-dependent methyltransferase [Kriegella aquimaris]|uniref:Methyltransferase domain-containing protein n=1 Tax=Kriegella aquimaris TaxID=192904 RepID=A0A1G9JF59_9FLAO|nr:class I SAM-dependent methyltransferase [Kriegella aquimaris]SDL35744.1 hypothetical protein SAMN04488514_101517 [Kriegella aquimaris]
MKEYPIDFWNGRYKSASYIYGTEPNEFFRKQLEKLKVGSILLPAEGEGRNAVYAAGQGWSVTAFDRSTIGREKALRLALNKKVSLTYEVADVMEFQTTQRFDVLGLMYAHFPKQIRKQAYQNLLGFLKPEAKVIFEAFAKEQLENSSGGPKNLDMLFSIEEIRNEFSGLKFEFLEQQTIKLDEGEHHQGKAEVIRFVGIKK